MATAKQLLAGLVHGLSATTPGQKLNPGQWALTRPSLGAENPAAVARITLSVYATIAGTHSDKVPFDVPSPALEQKAQRLLFALGKTTELPEFINTSGHLHDKFMFALLSVLTNYYFAGPEIPFTALLGKRDGSLGAFATIVVPTYLSMLKGGEVVHPDRLPHRTIEDVLTELAPKPTKAPLEGVALIHAKLWATLDKTPVLPSVKPRRVLYQEESPAPRPCPAGVLTAPASLSSPYLNLCWCAAAELRDMLSKVPPEIRDFFNEINT